MKLEIVKDENINETYESRLDNFNQKYKSDTDVVLSLDEFNTYMKDALSI